MSRAALLLLAPLLAPASAAAAWNVSGSNTLRYDHYQVSGDESASPYAEEGGFFYNQLDLTVNGNTRSGKSWRFDFSGVVNDSPYRSPHQGLVPEAARFVVEDAQAALPYKVELGDQAVRLSPLTLQRTLKGAGLTLSPPSRRDGRGYRIHGFAGTNRPGWRELEAEDNYYGVSLGMQDSQWGDFGLNLVFSHQKDADGGPDRRQTVASVTGARQFDVLSQTLKVSGELAMLRGDPDYPGGEAQRGYGAWGQIDGRHQTRPLDYRLRYDRSSADFRPNGSGVRADSEAMAAEAGWQFKSGHQLRGRLQRISDGVASDNPLRTDLVGATVSGPLRPSQPELATGKLDLELQEREDAAGTVEARSTSVKAGVVVSASPTQQTRVDLGLTRVDDRLRPGTESVTRQVAVSHAAKLKLGSVDLSISPGISYSRTDTDAGDATLGPTLSVEATRARDKLLLQLGRSEFDADGPYGGVAQSKAALKYEHRRGQHTFGIDLERDLREPELGEETDSWRAGAFWRYDFSKAG